MIAYVYCHTIVMTEEGEYQMWCNEGRQLLQVVLQVGYQSWKRKSKHYVMTWSFLDVNMNGTEIDTSGLERRCQPGVVTSHVLLSETKNKGRITRVHQSISWRLRPWSTSSIAVWHQIKLPGKSPIPFQAQQAWRDLRTVKRWSSDWRNLSPICG